MGKSWSLVGIFDRSYLLFPREDEKTLLVFRCFDHIFGNMLRFFIFISTCESWQSILKSREILSNGFKCWRQQDSAIVEEEGVDPDWVKILSHMRLPVEDCNLRGLIQTIYLDHQRHSGDAMYLMQRSIMAPKNTDVDEVNNAILESLFEELHTYLSAYSLASTKEGASVVVGISMDSLYPVEFLNTLQFNGITNHKLELKVGLPILLLCNLNQST